MSTSDDTRDDESRAVESLDEAFIEPGPRRSTYTPPPKPNVAAAAAAVGADPEAIVAEAAAAAAAEAGPEDVPDTDSETSPAPTEDPFVAHETAAPLTEIPIWGGFSEPVEPADLGVRVSDQGPGQAGARDEVLSDVGAAAPDEDTSKPDSPAIDDQSAAGQPHAEQPVFVEPAAGWQPPGEQPSSSWNDVPAPDSESSEVVPAAGTAEPEADSLESFIATSTDPSAAPTVYALDDVPLVDNDPPPLYFAAPPASVPESAASAPASEADAPAEQVYDLSGSSEDSPFGDPELDSTTPPPSFGSAQLPPPPFADEQLPPPPVAGEQLPPPPAPGDYETGAYDGNTYVMPPFIDSSSDSAAAVDSAAVDGSAAVDNSAEPYASYADIRPADGFSTPVYDVSAATAGPPEPTHDEPTYDEPTYDEPTYGEPTYGEPAFDEPTSPEPALGPFAMPAAAPATYSDPGTTVPSLSDLPGPGMPPPPAFDSPEAQAAFLANHAAPAGRPWIPERRSMSDDDLAAALTEAASTPSQRLDAMEELERQMHLREVEAREYSDWENSMLSVGTPEAIAAVEQLRPKFEDIVPVTTSIPIITPEIAAAFEAERQEVEQRTSPTTAVSPAVQAPSFASPAPETPVPETPAPGMPVPSAPAAWMPPPPSAPSMFTQSYASVESATVSDLPEAAPFVDAAPAPSEPVEPENATPSISFDDLFGETSSRASALASERAAAERAAATPAAAVPADFPAAPVAQDTPASPVEPVFEPFADPFFGRTGADLAASAAAVAEDDPQSPVTAPTQTWVAAEPTSDTPAAPEQQPFAWIIDPSQAPTPPPAAPPVDAGLPVDGGPGMTGDPALASEPQQEQAAFAVPPVTPPPLVEPPAYTGAFEFTSPSSTSPASSTPPPEPEIAPAAEWTPAAESQPAPASEQHDPATGLAFATAAATVAPDPFNELISPSTPSASGSADVRDAAQPTSGDADTSGALPSGSFAAILGDTNVDFQRPVEHVEPNESTDHRAPLDPPAAPDSEATFSSAAVEPVAEPSVEPRPDAAEAAAIAARPRAPRELPAFVPEASGEEPTPTDRRVGRAARQFWLWFAANSSVISIAFGGILFSLGMSLRQAIIATLAGVVLSFIPLGLGTLAGKRSGQPTMIVSRASFGVHGNIVPALISLVSRVFWGATLLWVLAASVAASLTALGATAGLSQAQLVILGLAIAFVLALIVAFFGYGLLARFQLVVSIVSALLVAGLIALTVQYIDIGAALTVPDGPLALVLTGAVLVFSFVGLVWANSSSDLARYQRPGSSSGGSMLWSTFGTTLPTFALISYGALLAASDPQIASGLLTNPLVTMAGLLPGWYLVPLVVATALSLLSGVVISIYSGGFALQAVGLRVKRQWSVVIVGVLLVVIAWVLSTLVGDLTLVFRDLATTLAVPVAAWAGIFAAETMIRNRAYDSASLLTAGGIYPAVRVVNLVGLFVIVAVGYALTTASLGWLNWQGYGLELIGIPLGSDLAASDFGVLVALLLGILLPLATGVPAIRGQEALMSAGTGVVGAGVTGSGVTGTGAVGTAALAPVEALPDAEPALVAVLPAEDPLATQLIEVEEPDAKPVVEQATDWANTPSSFLSDTDTVSGLWAAADPSAPPVAPPLDRPVVEAVGQHVDPDPAQLPDYPSTPPTPPVSPTPPN